MHIISADKATGEVRIDGGAAGPRIATDDDKAVLIRQGLLDASFAPKGAPAPAPKPEAVP